MNDKTQRLIIYIFGIDSIIGIVGLLLIIAFSSYTDTNIIFALMTVVSAPINLLGGFITGKSMSEVESETLKQKIIEDYEDQLQREESEEEGDCA